MAKKEQGSKKKRVSKKVFGLRAEVLEQPITETLEVNYMPYAMSVIVSRAIPEIDGFKPSHRKLLYTMYRMRLLGANRTKSANVVGETMKLNPHGDGAIYETLVRLSQGYEALLHPFLDSKGNFGKVYSRDMAYAASRYTEVRLELICSELFREIESDTVDFMDNYDGTLREPVLLPTTFPNILVSANQGIAVSMASNLCGFSLSEVCDTTIAYLKNPEHNLLTTLKAPDFRTGAELLYHREELERIYRTGRGSFKLRAKWRYIKEEHLIEVYEIPYTTTIETIMDKASELIKAGKIKEISDMRDETDLGGLKLTIDLKRGAVPEKLMERLFRQTPLLDTFSCNFNILIGGMPRVMGVREILKEWCDWRAGCVRRRVSFSLARKRERLHLLLGLQKLLLDLDRAIQIVRATKENAQVVPNLMREFELDEVQANFVADIKLRNMNEEYILDQTRETSELEGEIGDLLDILEKPERIRAMMIAELSAVKKSYGKGRHTEIIYEFEPLSLQGAEEVPEYPVYLFLSREGYFKKITPLSLRGAAEQKYKEGDGAFFSIEANNRDELLVFTDKQQCYKTRLSEFEDSKASALGDYLPAKLSMEEGEGVKWICVPGDYTAHLLLFFEDGKAARVSLAVYKTQTRRKKLTGAFSGKSPVVFFTLVREETDVVLFSSDGRALLLHTGLLAVKATRKTAGVAVFSPKAKRTVTRASLLSEVPLKNCTRYRARALPSSGAILREQDFGEEQLSFLGE